MRSPCAPLLLSAALLLGGAGIESVAGREFFSDDFEAYFDDVELTELGGWEIHDENDPPEGVANCSAQDPPDSGSTWTVTNPGGRATPPGEDGLPSDGQFIISDSDASCGGDSPDLPGTGQSHDIWTPSFSTEGSDSVWVHADCSAQLNNNGFCVFDVDVSIDDGQTWTNAFRRVAPSRPVEPLPTRQNADGFFGRLHIDISGVAANQGDVRVRFRHFEPNWDWWIALDNVEINDEPPPLGGDVTLLAPETFELGIPESWTVLSLVDPPNEGRDTWNTEDPCGRFNGDTFPWQDGHGVHRLDPPFAILDSDCDPDPPQDDWLITPVIDCSGAEEVFLHYKEEIDVTGAVQEVLLSVDGGETFDRFLPIFSFGQGALFDSGEDPFYAERIFEVPDAAGESEVAFAFHYAGGGNEWWWAIDDVSVTANGAGLDTRSCANRGFRVLGFDTAAVSATMEWRALPGDEGFRVLANGTDISGDLAPDVTSFTDTNPPKGSTTYTLQILAGGAVERECAAVPVDTFVPPSGLDCCADHKARTVTITWTGGVNLPGDTWRISRDGTSIATLPIGTTSFTDDTIPGPGVYQYDIAVEGAPADLFELRCRRFITATPLDTTTPCGGVVNQWDFNGDLSSSSGGLDLVPGVAPPLQPGVDAPGVVFETAMIGGEEAQVARYTRGTFFHAFTGLPPNGGGRFTNQYTLVMDVMFPAGALAESGWANLYQTSTTNSNDGEWYVNGGNRGIGIGGNYQGTIEDDTWYRLALVVDLVAGTYTSFIDGIPVQQNTGLGLDGQFSLFTVNDGDLEGILLFADENGENSTGLVNSVQIRDEALTPGFIAALGGPTAGGIPTTAPFSCPSNLLCCADRTSGAVTLTWDPGEKVAGTGWRITRDGLPLRTVPLDTGEFVDDRVPGPGVYEYQIILNGGDLAQCPNLPLTCSVRVNAAGSFVFFDDFDCYGSDQDVVDAGWRIVDENNPVENATWTITNPGARAGNPATGDGTPSTGNFLISDSDAASGANPAGTGMSHDVWSPPFDCSGLSTVWVHMDTSGVLNNNGNAVFDVDVSIDDGETWVNAFRRVAPGRAVPPAALADIPDGFPGGPQVGNADGFFGPIDVDITSVAAGESNVRVRVRHFEPNDDWWIAFDNFRVDDRPATGGPDVLVEADFNDGFPEDWTVDSDADGSAPWRDEDICQISLLNFNGGVFPDGADGRRLHHFDEGFAWVGPFEPDPAGGACLQVICAGDPCQDELLATPPIDASQAEKVFLHVRSSMFATDATAEILVSLDGGAEFEPEPVFSYNRGDPPAMLLRNSGNAEVIHNDYVFEVPAAAGESEVVFAFRYLNPAGTFGWWAIDDVKVTAGEPGPQGGLQVPGDCNQDGALNISDAVCLLGFLFQGNPTELPCGDGSQSAPGNVALMDGNGDGAINLSDAVFLLNFLFAGGPAHVLAVEGAETTGCVPIEGCESACQ